MPFRAPKPEILAPAGDRAAMEAAVLAGADAVYFGLGAFNARARATNFSEEELDETMAYLHSNGVKGYVTLNTLVFDSELVLVERAIRRCAEAGVDALIVQDLGVLELAQKLAPSLPLHASTQMTCTDASSVRFVRGLGARRVVLARELSLDDISKIREETDTELEVFVHGALCVAYSGQCLTSEAIGGRSANRGACAQACRLPYDLVVDGEVKELGEKAYLLSPEDLETSALVPELAKLGISCLKIEGRLKGADYVAATTRLYRHAVESAVEKGERELALQMFTRGSGPGFLKGVDHQRLVEAKSCDHRGLLVGEAQTREELRGKTYVRVCFGQVVTKGDGLLFEGGRASEGEVGGRVWSLLVQNKEVDEVKAGDVALVWLGPDKKVSGAFDGRRVFLTNSPRAEKEVRARLSADPYRHPVHLRVSGEIGRKPIFEAESNRFGNVRVEGETNVEAARERPITEEVLREKLGRLGDSVFTLESLTVALPPNAMLPLSSLNRARRALVDALLANAQRSHASTSQTSQSAFEASRSDRSAPPGGLFVLCRNVGQARAAIRAGADGVTLDFLELTGTGDALRSLREEAVARGERVHITVTPPRIRKPGEEKIDKYLLSLQPDAVLLRGLGGLGEASALGVPTIADFSLNVTNRLTAERVLRCGVSAFTPSFDLDSNQLISLLSNGLGPFAEVVVHHPMPLFHMEHCVFAALLSNGGDYKTCGRPCERHQVSLRDRAAMLHPIEADVGCRNTVFHGKSQSAATLVPKLKALGVSRFRIELVRETEGDVERVVTMYRKLIQGEQGAEEVWRALRLGAEDGYGVVRGSLRVLQ